MNTPPDNRTIRLCDIEKTVRNSVPEKDLSFKLDGPWKEYREEREGVKIFAVDFDWVYNNLSILFHHGGHGYVHEFIPIDEIWVSYNHHKSCSCKGVIDNNVSDRYFEATVRHELFELNLIKNGMEYWPAHNLALEKEKEWKLLDDPYTEKYDPL